MTEEPVPPPPPPPAPIRQGFTMAVIVDGPNQLTKAMPVAEAKSLLESLKATNPGASVKEVLQG